MPTTTHYQIPTPDYRDPADGPAAFKAVADQVDATLFAETGRLADAYTATQAAAVAAQNAAAQVTVLAGQQTALLLLGV